MITTSTPRDRLERLIDYARKARRYWWIIAGAIVIGGALSILFAVTRPPRYKSWSLLFYQERIQSSLLQGRQGTEQQRNLGERYREFLLSRDLLAQVVSDPAVNPFPAEMAKDGVDAAVEELRKAVALETRGINVFRISYTDVKPGRAQLVTARLTDLLKAKEEAIRSDQVEATVTFAEDQEKQAREQLGTRQKALSEFLATHPEFAQDEGGGAGASIRMGQNRRGTPSGNPRVLALERQISRIKARLAAPAGGVVTPRPPRDPSPAHAAALAAVSEAQSEVRAAERDLEAALAKYKDKHPDVINARDRVATAQSKLKRAQDAVPPDDEPVVLAPTSEADRDRLERQVAQLEDQLAVERRRDTRTAEPSGANDAVNTVVELETVYARLRDSVDEQRDRVETLMERVFVAHDDAQRQLAEQGARLSVLDAAFRPAKPFGQGKKILVLAGLALFAAIGLALAFGLAILDDRLYRRGEIEDLGLAPVLAVIPAAGKPRRGRSS